MRYDEKWPDVLQKFCCVNTARVLKYVWPIFIIMHERVKVLNVFKVKAKTRITQQLFTCSK